MSVQLPQLTLQQKWETAESNLLYFVICGITYAKTHGGSAEDFGTWPLVYVVFVALMIAVE